MLTFCERSIQERFFGDMRGRPIDLFTEQTRVQCRQRVLTSYDTCMLLFFLSPLKYVPARTQSGARERFRRFAKELLMSAKLSVCSEIVTGGPCANGVNDDQRRAVGLDRTMQQRHATTPEFCVFRLHLQLS